MTSRQAGDDAVSRTISAVGLDETYQISLISPTSVYSYKEQRQSDIQSTQGEGGTFQFQAFDEFKSYPLDLTGGLDSLPENAWSKWAS